MQAPADEPHVGGQRDIVAPNIEGVGFGQATSDVVTSSLLLKFLPSTRTGPRLSADKTVGIARNPAKRTGAIVSRCCALVPVNEPRFRPPNAW